MVIVIRGAAALHPPSNIAKTAGGTPLTDEDRRPWLEVLGKSVGEWIVHDSNAVMPSSLLSQTSRAAVLGGYESCVNLVYLHARARCYTDG